MMSSPFGIYIHVPYCRVACPYCDFVKKPVEGDAPAAFAVAVSEEIRAFEGPDDVGSVFFGGGTPSMLDKDALRSIFESIHARFTLRDPEISLEANPDDVTEDLLWCWRDLGVNRLSLGVQSFDDDVLAYLGRCHDAGRARKACAMVAHRFENWGMDLIFGARPVEAWGPTLSECRAFDPPHVSTYGLTFEEKTPFWKRRDEAIDSDRSLDFYREAMETLADYDHYEVSNFAKSGFQSMHNQIYWRNGEYAGFGPGAYSFLGGVRSRNSTRINRYLTQPGEKVESLPLEEREIQVETLLQYFRTRCGLPREDYVVRFGHPVEEDFGPTLAGLVQRGLLEDDGEAIRPTRRGYELNNEIGLALVS